MVAFKALDRLLYQPLALGIQGAGGLVENQQFRVAENPRAKLRRCRWPPLSR